MYQSELNYCYNCMARLESGQTVCPACGYDNSVNQNPQDALPEGTFLMVNYMVGKVLDRSGISITYLGVHIVEGIKVVIREYFPAGVAIRSDNPWDPFYVTTKSDVKTVNSIWNTREKYLEGVIRIAAIKSPVIVRVMDCFRFNGTAYVVVDYMDGNSLTEEVKACGGRIPWQRAMELFKPLIIEMEKLHEEHLIRWKITPQYMMVVKEKDGTERLVLPDFESVCCFDGLDIFPYYLGSGYTPIEEYSLHNQKEKQPYTDIYILCAAMYAVITGNLPANPMERLDGKSEIRSFSEMGIEIPTHIEKAILHGLALFGKDRPQSMRELYDELEGKEPEVS